MIYMTPDNCNLIKNRDQPFWGQIITPASYAKEPKALLWCGDNEAFTRRYTFRRFYGWLWRFRRYRQSCVFVAAPDVVGDARKTLIRYLPHWILMKLLGFPVALVAQDGLEDMDYALRYLPYDALFIGGSTDWKMSFATDYCIWQAKRRGKWVHVGRVNSQKRIRHFKLVGVDSVDGTSLTYAPDRDYWVFQKVLMQPVLFTIGE